MILKQKDSLDHQLQHLELAIQHAAPGLERQRRQKQLAQVRAGLKGEQEAAYHIDFHLRDSQNWAVIHDLRIEWNGRVAQLDHLLINRLLEIWVVESKSVRTKIRQANGGWERLNFNHWEGIPCPLEQNQRHIMVLEELIEHTRMSPTRLGVVLKPKFLNVVVVQPACSILGKLPHDARIYRMDKLVRRIRDEDRSALDLLKMISADTLHALAVGLAGYHRPAPKLVLPPQDSTAALDANGGEPVQKCQTCGGPVTNAEANYCRANSARFAAQLLCRKCQSYAPAIKHNAVGKPLSIQPLGSEVAASCVSCGTGLDQKVLAFCRCHSKRFNGRVLCRACQVAASWG